SRDRLRLGLVHRAVVVTQPREHAQHVAVDDRLRAPEGEARDGGGRVGADPRERTQALYVVREGAAELSSDDAGGPVQVSPARVVAEAGPEREHLVLLGGGEGGDVREALQEALE